MALTVTITDNTLTILDNGVAATFNGSELLHPSYIAEVEQLTDGVALTPAPSAEGVPSDYAGNVVNYVVVLRFSDSKHQPLEIRLADVTNQPGWTNDQAGAIQAVTDIAVIMVLSGGGGGSGTVTSINVSGGTTGLTTSGGPVTTSGTITLAGTLDLDNGGTGATTAAGARANLGAADIYPTFTFSTNTTTNADPGAGFFRFNNATMGSVSEFCISNTAHFDGGDQDVGFWMYGWAGQLVLRNIANNDIIIASLNAQLNQVPYLRTNMGPGVSTVIGGVANAQPTNGSVWRFVSVGDYIINYNTQSTLAGKQDRLRNIISLNDTDAVNLSSAADTYYQANGSGVVNEAVNAAAGTTLVLKCATGATQLDFASAGGVDGVGTLTLLPGASAQIQNIDGAGNWIIIG